MPKPIVQGQIDALIRRIELLETEVTRLRRADTLLGTSVTSLSGTVASFSGTVDAEFTGLSGTINSRFALGALLNVQKFTTSSVYAPTVGTKRIVVEMVGAGGGSGACIYYSGSAGTTAGGASGVYLRKFLTLTSLTGTVVVGSASNGGIPPTGAGPYSGVQRVLMAGKSGQDTVFFINDTNLIAKGGTGTSGTFGSSSNLGLFSNGGLVKSGSSDADVVWSEPGGDAMLVYYVGDATTGTKLVGPSGKGGSNPLGRGGVSTQIASTFGGVGGQNGANGSGYGAGAGGSMFTYDGVDLNQPLPTGGSGSQGVVIVYEYS